MKLSNLHSFIDYIQKFQQFTRCTPENPILLLLDNHVSHRNLEVLKFCRENGIHVLSFPPHCSHLLQPLDVSVLKPFKTTANTLCGDWVTAHPGRVMTIYDLPPVFDRALQLSATETNIKSGFRASGIFPLDRQIFQEIDFMPSTTTDRPYTPDDVLDENDIPWGQDLELPHNRSQQSIEELGIVMEEDEEQEEEMTPIGTSTPRGSLQDLSSSLESLRPFPKAAARKPGNQRGRKKGKTSILTGDEAFNEIEAEQVARDAKKQAIEDRKVAAAAKKQAKALQKLETARKKAEKQAEKKSEQVAKRVSARRNTTAVDYAYPSDDDDDL